MKILSSSLINLPVQTKGGTDLGKVSDFEINIDSGALESLYVKTGLIKGLWHEQLVIGKDQIISITAKKVVVSDLAIKEKKRVPRLNLSPAVE